MATAQARLRPTPTAFAESVKAAGWFGYLFVAMIFAALVAGFISWFAQPDDLDPWAVYIDPQNTLVGARQVDEITRRIDENGVPVQGPTIRYHVVRCDGPSEPMNVTFNRSWDVMSADGETITSAEPPFTRLIPPVPAGCDTVSVSAAIPELVVDTIELLGEGATVRVAVVARPVDDGHLPTVIRTEEFTTTGAPVGVETVPVPTRE